MIVVRPVFKGAMSGVQRPVGYETCMHSIWIKRVLSVGQRVLMDRVKQRDPHVRSMRNMGIPNVFVLMQVKDISDAIDLPSLGETIYM